MAQLHVEANQDCIGFQPRLVRLILNPCTKRYVHGKPHVKAILMKMERVLQRGVHVQDRFQVCMRVMEGCMGLF